MIFYTIPWILKNQSMKKIICWALAATVVIGSACDDDDDRKSLQQADKDFAMNATMANKAEIELGDLASDNGEMEGVRMFGMQMMEDHQTALDELKAIAANYEVTLSETLDAEHQQLKQQLMTMSGHSFDSTYISSQVKDHQKVITMFQNEIANGTNGDLKAYASKYLPHIQAHLAKADSISAVMGQ
jgi:putative membrane protein